MEHTREIKIEIEVDTNKATYTEKFDNFFSAAEYLWGKLSDEERLSLPRCHGCGSLDTSCQCWNDE